MNEKPTSWLERIFKVTLFGQTREVEARSFACSPTRFIAFSVLAGRYRSGSKYHFVDLEFETGPDQELLFNRSHWQRGEGCVFRPYAIRNYGNHGSLVRTVGWANEFPNDQFA